ncbi:MAG TPA: hypothetical protein VLJ20_07700 [Acetobacteraceae bacterium]|nr:hypothetical protein [Acetobacteraceae bacterium]
MSPLRCALLSALLVLANCGPVRIGRESVAVTMHSNAPAASADDPSSSGPVEQVAYRSGSPDFSCSPGAVTCLRVNGRAAGGNIVPATFGVPFAPGQVPAGTALAANVRGQPVPLQMDERSSYPDGSLRLAIFSLALPEGSAGQIVSLAPGAAAGGPAVDPASWLNAGHDVKVLVNLYSPQVSTIVLGNNKGTTAGTPFQVGDTITVHLGDDPAETYTVRVTEKTAGGNFGTLRLLSEELNRAMSGSTKFRSYKIGEGGGYGKLWVTSRGGSGTARPFTVRVETSSQAPVRTEITQQYEAPKRYSASARAMLGRSSPRAWLSGPVAGEIMLSGPLMGEDGRPHPRLTARMNLRVYAGVPEARTDVIVEDLWTYQPGARNWHYDVAVEQDGKVAFQKDDLTHYHHARWHKVVWSGTDPDVFVQYDRHHFINSRAVQHYDERLSIPGSIIETDYRNLVKTNTGPMGNANVMLYFGTTGGRADIGPVPRWTTLYLLTMDPREYTVMMANADASGSIPIHYRDRKTDRPVSIDDHPGIVTGDWPPSSGKDKIPPTVDAVTPWSPEPSHQPSLVFIPYIVSGDRYYMEESQFWATWNLGVAYPPKRGGSEGIVLGTEQTRRDAWALRSLAEAAEITPDRDPMKHYFESKLENNLKYALARYAKRSNPIGLDAIFNERGDKKFAPWQVDFLIMVLDQIAGNRYAGADTWLKWLGQIGVGLWTNEQNGFCRMNAPAGWLFRNRPDGQLISSWSELHKASFPNQVSCPTTFPKEAYQGSPIGYIIDGMSAAAILSNYEFPGARQTYDWLNERESNIPFARDPSWRIVPR